MFGLSFEVRILAIVGLAMALLVGAEWKLAQARQEGRTACQTAYQAQSIAEERRRVTALAEVANEAQRMEARSRTAADAARGSLGRLLERARGTGLRSPALASPSAPASSSPDLRGDVLGGVGEAARQLAEAADAARDAGTACERSYDSLPQR